MWKKVFLAPFIVLGGLVMLALKILPWLLLTFALVLGQLVKRSK